MTEHTVFGINLYGFELNDFRKSDAVAHNGRYEYFTLTDDAEAAFEANGLDIGLEELTGTFLSLVSDGGDGEYLGFCPRYDWEEPGRHMFTKEEVDNELLRVANILYTETVTMDDLRFNVDYISTFGAYD